MHLPGILDPQGATVERALPALGYHNVGEVSIAKTIRLVIDAGIGRRRTRAGRRDVSAAAGEPGHRAVHDRDHGAVTDDSMSVRA